MDTYRLFRYNQSILGEVPICGYGSGKGSESVPVSEAQKKASVKYLEKLDEIRIRMPKGKKEIIQAAAVAAGESVNAYINAAISQRMEREAAGPT